jgi:hypothetical protein
MRIITISGMEIARQEIDHRQWIKLSGIKTDYAPIFTDLIKQEDAASIFDSVNLTNREASRLKNTIPCFIQLISIHGCLCRYIMGYRFPFFQQIF